MPPSTPSVRTEDDRLIVEAATAEEALDVVAQQLGTRARIAGVERVRRGGVGGFFARELVQVTATGEDVKVQPEQPATNASAAENTVDALLRTISERDDPFAAALQRQIAPTANGNGNGHAGVDGEPAASSASSGAGATAAAGRARDAAARWRAGSVTPAAGPHAGAAERAAVAGAAVDVAHGEAAGSGAGRAPAGPGPAERWAAALASAAPDAGPGRTRPPLTAPVGASWQPSGPSAEPPAAPGAPASVAAATPWRPPAAAQLPPQGAAGRTGVPDPPAAVGPQAAVEAVAAGLPGTPKWSLANLCRVGVPPLLAPEEAARLAPGDDIGWTAAVAASLQRLCGAPPAGPTIFVGPAAERLGSALELPVHWPGQQTPTESFVAPISGRAAEREWLASVRAGRHLHLVVGGPGWRGLLFEEPAVLSHTAASMCEAVSLAFQLGIGLGYTVDDAGDVTRVNPMELAVAIRRLLPTHR